MCMPLCHIFPFCTLMYNGTILEKHSADCRQGPTTKIYTRAHTDGQWKDKKGGKPTEIRDVSILHKIYAQPRDSKSVRYHVWCPVRASIKYYLATIPLREPSVRKALPSKISVWQPEDPHNFLLTYLSIYSRLTEKLSRGIPPNRHPQILKIVSRHSATPGT